MTEAKIEITDELLVAYVDDELDTSQRALVNATLEHDADLRGREAEMRLSRHLLREAFPLQSFQPVPPRLDAAAERLAAAACAEKPRAAGRAPQTRFRYVLAAAAAVCAVGSAAYFARQPLKSTPLQITTLTQIPPGNPLHTLLESTPSAQMIEVPEEGASLRAVLTFQANDGRFCREFEIFARSGASTGIACRENGRWRTEILMSTNATPPSTDDYTPAAGSDDPALAAVVEKLMQEDPFSAEEEAQVLGSGWSSGGT